MLRRAAAVYGRTRWEAGVWLRSLGARLAPPGMEESPKYRYELNVTHRERLAGRCAIVTGGSGSIGSALSYRLAAEGATVAVAGRNESGLHSVVKRIVEGGVPAERLRVLVMDVTSEDSVASAITSFSSSTGRLDFLINNAGGSARSQTLKVEDQDLDVIAGVLDVNLLGAIRCAKYAVPHLRRTNGRIVNFGSVIALAGQPAYADYAASKGGVAALTRSLALELAADGVTVNTVTPGQVWRNSFDGSRHRATDKTALGRYGTSEEVAGLVAYLCSDEASYITGVEIPIDGGRLLGLAR